MSFNDCKKVLWGNDDVILCGFVGDVSAGTMSSFDPEKTSHRLQVLSTDRF